MKLSELQAAHAFVPVRPVKKEVPIKRPVPKPKSEWAEANVPEFTDEVVDDSLTVFIHRGYAADSLEMIQASERERPFVAILRGIVHEDGKPVFASLTEIMGDPSLGDEDRGGLAPWIVFPLFTAITEVAGHAPKPSRRATSSGSKRASRSASRKPNSNTD